MSLSHRGSSRHLVLSSPLVPTTVSGGRSGCRSRYVEELSTAYAPRLQEVFRIRKKLSASAKRLPFTGEAHSYFARVQWYRRIEKKGRSIGFHVDEFHSKIGKTFPILSERFMRPGVLIVVNFEAFRYGYYANDLLERKEIATQGRYQRWLISFQTYGVVAWNPRANIGMIHGLPAG